MIAKFLPADQPLDISEPHMMKHAIRLGFSGTGFVISYFKPFLLLAFASVPPELASWVQFIVVILTGVVAIMTIAKIWHEWKPAEKRVAELRKTRPIL